MDEILRMQKLAGIDEIKINNPIDIFTVTDYGRQTVNDFVTMEKLSQKFGVGELLKDEGPESELYRIPQLLYIFSDTYGEGIIKMNERNKNDDYFERYLKIWDDSKEYAEIYLSDFKKLNLIK